jgi:cytoskeleton protein RodZ
MIDGTGEAASPPLLDPPASGAAVQTPGALLQQERMRRGLSVQQSAEGLHLDIWIVEAIEANQFLALGAPVYAKGYLRKYASMLGLAPDVIVARYEALSDTPVVPTPVPVITTTPPPRPSWPKYLAWSVLAAGVIGIGFLAFHLLMPALESLPDLSTPATTIEQVSTPTSMPVAQPTAIQAQPMAPPAATQVVPERRPVSAPSPKPIEAASAAPVDRAPAASDTPAVVDAGSPVQLRLEFNEASWVEVYDASGQRLVYDIGQPGRSRVVSGAAPLDVVVGLASAVNVQVNDQAIIVPRRANRDSTRFRVAADGSVQ